MKTRFLSIAAALLLWTHVGIQAQTKDFVPGVDYKVLDKRVATEVAPGKVEVIEFFWYSCPHCAQFEPQLVQWIKKAPKNVEVRRVPVAFRPDFEPQQRLFYTLQAMGKLDALHAQVFTAIHIDKQDLKTAEAILIWAEKQGLDRAKFSELYNSFSVVTKAKQATKLQGLYSVDGVPALAVAGRFYTSGNLTGNMPRALAVVDYLITLARKTR